MLSVKENRSKSVIKQGMGTIMATAMHSFAASNSRLHKHYMPGKCDFEHDKTSDR